MRELPPPGSKRTQVELSRIRTDGDTQSRVSISSATVQEYADDLRGGADFPPVVLFFDGETYWLASGFHRCEAHRLINRKHIESWVARGSVADARFYAASCNADHGVRRTHGDKRRSVMLVLAESRSADWTASRIADYCGVSTSFVRAMQQAGKQAGDWSPRPGLFGPDDLQVPPSPSARVASAESGSGNSSGATNGVAPPHVGKQDDDGDVDFLTESDREKILERARRSWAKLVRFADALRLGVDDLLSRLRNPGDDAGNGGTGPPTEGEPLPD